MMGQAEFAVDQGELHSPAKTIDAGEGPAAGLKAQKHCSLPKITLIHPLLLIGV